MKRKTFIIVSIVVALVASGAFAATAIHARQPDAELAADTADAPVADTAPAQPKIRPVNVRTWEVAASDLTESILANGITSPKTDVTFSAEIPGRIEHLGAELGQKVRKGQVLARIGFETLKAQQTHAKAAYDLAETTHGRFASLGPDLVTRQKLDETRSAVTSARAQLEIAQSNLKKSQVRSTINGVVSAKHVDRAEYVAPGTPLFQVVDYKTIVVEARLAETQIGLVKKGSQVTASINALGREFPGVVKAIVPTADPASKTFTVRVEIKNPDLAILVGMSATLKIPSRTHQNAVVVAQDAVIEGKDGRSVFVAQDDKAVERAVRLGATDGDRVVVLDGLSPGDALIVLGQRDLSDGQAIQITQ